MKYQDREGLLVDMRAAARRAVDDNPRHSQESLFDLVGDWFPDATDGEVDTVVQEVLP
jgi:hypothetical protein